jgi:L-ascorbate metabolism protein UlaG (beta-lactamase superfamily)
VTGVSMTWLGHSTVVVELDDTRVVTDPVLRRRVALLRRDSAVPRAALVPLDAVLLSHVHFDHFDLPSLARLGPPAVLVVPRGAAKLVRKLRPARVHEVVPGDELQLGNVRVEVTYAEHDAARTPFTGRLPALGFVLRGSSSVYFAGDTDVFAGMRALRPLDVALLPIAGWGPRVPAGHLDPERAAVALELLRPKVAVPIHWGTFRTPFAPTPTDLPARLFEGAAHDRTPEVEVVVLEPGGSWSSARLPPCG